MGTKVTTPSTTTWTETELQNFISWVEKAQVGMISINLTALDTTAVPDIEAGSIVEIAGAVYQFPSAETPSGWADIANDTQTYIKLVPSGDSVSAEFTATAPTYDADLGGWYDGNDRYVAWMYKDASGNADRKAVYLQTTEQGHFPEDLNVKDTLRVGTAKYADFRYNNIVFSVGSDQDGQITFASDAWMLWDESTDEFIFTKGIDIDEYITGGTQVAQIERTSDGTSNSTVNVYKPITCYLTWDVPGVDHTLSLQVNQNSDWGNVYSTTANGTTGAEYGIMLNPGAYRIYMSRPSGVTGTSTFTLYITGAYGTDTLSKATS